ncbi:hypothetical protein SERLADRAFT_400147, partial [Serpula lacrymans var. lacrymans S7.9]
DFWVMGREVGVEYGRVYDVPLEGFEEAKRRREADKEREREFEHEHEGSGIGNGRGKGLFGKLGLRMNMGSGRRGYEPLNTSQV